MWSTIEIGAGFIVSALGGFEILESSQVNWALIVIGVILILHGIFGLWIKPRFLLKRVIKGWLVKRRWSIYTLEREDYKKYHFVFIAENAQNYRVSISRSKENKDVLVFHMTLPSDLVKDINVSLITNQQQEQLIEELRLFLATKNIPFEGIKWPLDEKVIIERILPINSGLSKHNVDDMAKELVFASLRVNTIIRKFLALSTPDKEGSPHK